MRVICVCFLTMAWLAMPGFAQHTPSSYDLWLVRSQAITADLVKDSADLPTSERALLWAKLAQKWWRDDPKRARAWMLKPIEMVEAVPNMENPDERRERLNLTRSLLEIVASLDQKLSERLIAILIQGAEQDAKGDRASDTDGLLKAAQFLVEKDPQRAVELGKLALRLGRPTQVEFLIFSLRRKNALLAEALLAQTLAAARQSLDYKLLGSLTQVAFHDSEPRSAIIGARPDDLRIELLKLDIAFLQANPINAENRTSVCQSIDYFIAPILPQFERLLPQEASMAWQALNQCTSTHPPGRQRADDALRNQRLNTVDDLLKVAGDSEDLKVRTVYLFRAALLAKQQGDFDRALKILDSMSTESREFSDGTWEVYRWDWAAISALRHFKSGEVHDMRLILNAVPAGLQPYARMAFIDGLPANRDKDTDPTLEFLSDVRMSLRSPSLSDGEKSVGYFGLLPLILKYQHTEATAVLREAVAALNRAEQTKDKSTGNHDRNSLAGVEFSKLFLASLLEMDEYAVKEAVSSIASPIIRTQVRLGLLSGCLERLRMAKQKTPNQARTTSKGE